jgi:hypothetical protein
MIYRLAIFSFLFILISGEINGQDEKLVQFSGVIRNLKYEPVPDVNIINFSRRTGDTSNENGLFSMIVRPSDSILFRAVGYKNTLVIIPDSITRNHYPRDIYMLNDTIHLAEVKIFPWKTYDEFKVAFINLELPNDDEQRAYKNIERIKAQLNMDFEPSANLAFRQTMQQRYDQMYYAGQYPSIPILNPFNWAKFFNAVKSGDFNRKDKDK